MNRVEPIFPLIALLLLAFGLPFPTFHVTYSKFTLQTIFCALALIACGAWGLAASFHCRAPAESAGRGAAGLLAALWRRLPFRLLLGLVVLSVGSGLWCGSREAWCWSALFLVTNAAWMVLVYWWIRQRGDGGAILAGYLGAAIAASVVGLAVFLRNALANPALWDEPSHRLLAPIGNANFMASFLITPLLMAFVSAGEAGLALFGAERDAGDADSRSALRRNFGLLAFVGIFLAIVFLLTGSRGGGLGILAGGSVLILMLVGRRARYILLLGAAVAVFAAALTVMIVPSVLDRLKAEAWSGTNMTRLFLWGDALRMIAARPFLGWGGGGFSAFQATMKSPQEAQHYYLRPMAISAHNEFLETGVDYGLIGMAIYIALIVSLIVGALRSPRFKQSSPALKAAVAGFIGLNVHSCFDVGLRFWDLAPFFWLLAAVLLAFPDEAGAEESGEGPALPQGAGPPPPETTSPAHIAGHGRRRLRRAIPALAVAAVGLAWCAASGVDLVGQINLEAGRRAQKARRYQEACVSYEAALQRALYFSDRVRARMFLSDCLRRTGRLTEAIAALERLQRYAPNVKDSRLMLGLLYEQAADQLAKAPTDRIEYLKMAVASLREYLNANNDVNGYMILANVFLSEKHANYKAALVALAEGLSLNPECLEVRRFMVNCLRKTNRHKDALDHMHVILRSPSALPVDYLMTADILRVLGRKANARQVLKAGVERFPQRAAMLERELRRGTEEKKDEGTSANRPAF